MARRQPTEATRRQAIAYARKASRLMEAGWLLPSAVDARAVRLLVETMPRSDGERRHVFSGLSKFLTWCRRQGLIDHNPCDALDRSERPKPGRARDHVPSLAELKAVGPPLQTSLCATSSASCCSSRFDATKPQAFVGPRSTSIADFSSLTPNARRTAKRTNCRSASRL
jgi:hypothetical protein